jgi:hypothetical protein
MNRRLLVAGLIVAGLCLFGVGLAWDRLVPSSAYWSVEQAKEYTAAQLEMHTKSHQHGADGEQEMAVARERFAKVNRQLERARGSQKFSGTLFLAAGITLLLVGVALHVSRQRSG